MAGEPKTVKCATCGKKMVIPRGYENVPGRCSQCGAPVNLPQPVQRRAPIPDKLDINNEVLDLDVPSVEPPDVEHIEVKGLGLEALGLDTPPKETHKPATPQTGSRPQTRRWFDPARVHEYLLALPKALGMGAIGALVGGAIVGTILYALGSEGESFTVASTIARSDTGIMGGFVLGTGWSLVKKLQLSPLSGLVICGLTGMVLGTLFHLFEVSCVAPADNPIYGTAAACFFGGGVVGAVLGYTIGESDS